MESQELLQTYEELTTQLGQLEEQMKNSPAFMRYLGLQQSVTKTLESLKETVKNEGITPLKGKIFEVTVETRSKRTRNWDMDKIKAHKVASALLSEKVNEEIFDALAKQGSIEDPESYYEVISKESKAVYIKRLKNEEKKKK